jgi:hypothetical protein
MQEPNQEKEQIQQAKYFHPPYFGMRNSTCENGVEERSSEKYI